MRLEKLPGFGGFLADNSGGFVDFVEAVKLSLDDRLVS